MIEKLLPCKKCKSKAGITITSYSFENKESFAINCDLCNNRIDAVKSEDKAVNNWNQLNKG